MSNLYQDYKRTKELIADMCDGDKHDFKNLTRRSIYSPEDLEAATIFIKVCEDAGVHLLAN